jgi:hypothetical protein
MLANRTPLVCSLLLVVAAACANKDSGGDDASAMTLAPTDTGNGDDDDDGDDPDDPSDPTDPDPTDPDPTMPDDTTGGSGDDCCAAHAGPGCGDAEIEACVCEEDQVCCTFDWDAACVNTARMRCGACGGGGLTTETTTDSTTTDDGSTSEMTSTTTDPTAVTTDPTGGGAACCEATKTPGCPSDPQLEACVCQLDPFCCDDSWDNICVGQATADCSAQCVFGTGCCEPHPTPGCDTAAVQMCVCAIDPFCCEKQWDMLCVEQVTTEQCGSC